MEKKFLVGITGASGAIYAYYFLKELKKLKIPTEVIITRAGEMVWNYELEKSVEEILNFAERLYKEDEIYSPPASGSSNYSGMIIIPCTMGTLSAIACGSARNLLQRAADVMLKERKPLILIIRETPFNLIHIKNMEICSKAGAVIFPAMPGFYHKPKSLEELVIQFVKRILQFLGFNQEGLKTWEEIVLE
ncbi:MAG: aromatic acid decarboxylase [Thermodesulfobacterium geofontis]|uniref:Flavin prenyltransferase UbiX n=1 Tax=Thermodesulfobacterium geofontis TaxID=1295609 RepID=A0A2N7PQK4_9BACT|nr:MAG: aromatic acid decarboxylase [Thermodesulfobacterium geofontis]PMP94641.1 MAG: aromatic acid decarboxylase [Thermodesulfobacterium geofontis]